jgi:hypothetical protein
MSLLECWVGEKREEMKCICGCPLLRELLAQLTLICSLRLRAITLTLATLRYSFLTRSTSVTDCGNLMGVIMQYFRDSR